MEQLVHIEDYKELFTDIQRSGLFADQKSVADSIPRRPVQEIVELYRKEKHKKYFDLRKFFDDHFDLPEEKAKATGQKIKQPIEEYIETLWDELTRYPENVGGTLIPLPGKFIVPGGRFGEIYYWDSYFTMLGLQVSGRIDLIESMVDNFASLIDRFGFIPNGNRTYFLSRSQPPFFSFMIELLAEEKGDQEYLKYLPQLEREYAFWMDGEDKISSLSPAVKRVVRLPDGTILNRYWDALNEPRPEGFLEDLETAGKAGDQNPEIFRDLRAGAESGWDFSSRWLADGKSLHTIRTTRIIPVDLNCILLHTEQILEYSYQLLKEENKKNEFAERAARRTKGIREYCWDENEKIYGDYDFENNRPTRAATLGMAYALVLKIATFKQVADIVYQLESRFLQPGGLLSTLVVSGQQWDAPNGWAPLHWMAFKGLMNYGYKDLASRVAGNWMRNIESCFEETGKITEKYNVMKIGVNAGGGEYPNQDGFGWTNGVYLKLKSF